MILEFSRPRLMLRVRSGCLWVMEVILYVNVDGGNHESFCGGQ